MTQGRPWGGGVSVPLSSALVGHATLPEHLGGVKIRPGLCGTVLVLRPFVLHVGEAHLVLELSKSTTLGQGGVGWSSTANRYSPVASRSLLQEIEAGKPPQSSAPLSHFEAANGERGVLKALEKRAFLERPKSSSRLALRFATAAKQARSEKRSDALPSLLCTEGLILR